MKGKHEKDVVKLKEQEILHLINSRLGIEKDGGPSDRGHVPAEQAVITGQSGLQQQGSRTRNTDDSSEPTVRHSAMRQVMARSRPKKNIVTPDQYDWANRLIPSFQLGIDVALTQIASTELRDLLFHDFFFIEILQFSPSLLDRVNNRFESFTLKAYAPMAFAHFRKLFNVRDDIMRKSLCEDTLTMVVNAGASGSIFYVSSDRQFVLKTVTKKEAKFLQELLPEYYMNIHQNPSTFLPRFYGLFVVKRYTCVMRLVIMNNIIRPGLVRRKFDLKGSRYHRKYRPGGSGDGEVGTNIPTLKDLDFVEVFPNGIVLTPDVYGIVSKTLERDVLVLQSFEIMDYSLLLAIRPDTTSDLVASASGRRERRDLPVSVEDSFCEIHKRHNCIAPNCCTRRLTRKLAEIVLPCGGIPASGESGEPLVIYMGIIDILQDYGLKKIMEHFLKSMCIRSSIEDISVQPPDYYAFRFSEFITHSVFRQTPGSPSGQSTAPTTAPQSPLPAIEAARPAGLVEMATALFPGRTAASPEPPASVDGGRPPSADAGGFDDPSQVTSKHNTSRPTKAPSPVPEVPLPSQTRVVLPKERLRLPAVVSKTKRVASVVIETVSSDAVL